MYKPELAIFDYPEVQTVIERGVWIDVYPSSVHYNKGPLEFEIVGNDDYLDLNDTILYINASVVKEGDATAGGRNVALATSDDAAFVNMPMHSMFSDVMVYLNDTKVDGGDQFYPYKAMISNLFGYSASTLSTNAVCWVLE